MFLLSFNLILLAALSVVNSLSFSDIQCDVRDNECVKYLLNTYAPEVIAGIPSMEIPSADPLYQNEIEGYMFNLKYVLSNSTIEGLKNCRYVNVHSHPDTFSLSFEMLCPSFLSTGNYDFLGDMFTFPVESKGRYQFVTGFYKFSMDCKLEKVLQRNGNVSLTVKDFSSYITALEPVEIKFENMFKENKKITDIVLNFIGENWKYLTVLFQDPMHNKNMKRVIYNVNQFLSTISVPRF